MSTEEHKIFLFDVDGTLTVSRKEITSEMREFINNTKKKVTCGIVGGSDINKQKHQLGSNVIQEWTYVFAENGLDAYKNGKQLAKQNLAETLGDDNIKELVNAIMKYISGLDIPLKRGTFIEFRSGMLNVSPIGRNCSRQERNEFEIYDKQHKVRETMIEALSNLWEKHNLKTSIGGQISFDVFPNGWDKTFCLPFVEKDGFTEIHFFGDKTWKGGNDYEIFQSSKTIGHTVKSPAETREIITKLLEGDSKKKKSNLKEKKNESINSSTPCCPSTRVPALTSPLVYKQKGKSMKFDGLNVYIVGSPGNKKAIVVIADVFGMKSGRHAAIADQFASNGYYVIMPDLFHDDKVTFSDIPTPRLGEFLKTWPPAKWSVDMDKVYAHLEHKNIEKIGLIGFCWGCWAIFHESARGAKFHAGVNFHPSLGIEAKAFNNSVDVLAKKCRTPMLLGACQDDPDNVCPGGSVSTILSEKPFGDGCQYHHFKEVRHGFMTQGELTSTTIKNVDLGMKMATDFFSRHLSLNADSTKFFKNENYHTFITRIKSEGQKNWLPLQNDLLLRAARGEPTDRVPVWIHRQAGRYLPEFLEVYKHNDFFTMCRTPEIACKVTLQPLIRFPLDAAIIFSDILVIPQALGLEVQIVPGKGPVFSHPLVDPSHLERLDTKINVYSSLGYVFDAISLTRTALRGRVPLIGFSGAPLTIMFYMVHGSTAKSTWFKAKTWLYKYPAAAHKLLKIITDITIEYLIGQVQAGAQLLEIFETVAGDLTPELFKVFSLPYLTQISSQVKSRLGSQGLDIVPMTLFPRGAHYALEWVANCGYDVISIDWTIDPKKARARVGERVTLQGNLDPCALYGGSASIKVETEKMVKAFGTQGYIANLGHGMLPTHDASAVATFVDAVHSVSAQINMKNSISQLENNVNHSKLFVKKLSKNAVLPTRGSDRAAGYDLSSAHDIIIPAQGKGIAKTDLAIALPTGTYGRVAPRSGLSWKKHTDVGAGVIDEDYRGNVGVVLFNHSKEDLHIKAGDRVAQLIVEKIAHTKMVHVDELDSTKRGAGGFGSTGTSSKHVQRKQ